MGRGIHSGVPLFTLTIVGIVLAIQTHAAPPATTGMILDTRTDEIRLDISSQITDTAQFAILRRESPTFSASLIDRFWTADPFSGPLADLDWLDTERFPLTCVAFDLRTSEDEDSIAFASDAPVLHATEANVELQKVALGGIALASLSK